jgi:hypothetical protein
MTLENIFYSLGIVLMISLIILFVVISVGLYYIFKQVKVWERSLQAKISELTDQTNGEGSTRSVWVKRALPILGMAMPLIFRFMRRGRKF